jgi:leader peptidase (prepilin peptidase)/N-methyltransferase
MTTEMSVTRTLLERPWLTAALAGCASAAVAALLFTIVTSPGYAWGLTACLAGGATPIAIVDARTHILPNRYSSAIAAGGLIQAATIAIASHSAMRFLDCLIAAAAVGAAYVALGLLGWFGFGDAKFAAALTVTVAIYAGLAALYIVPLAIFLAAIWMLLCRLSGLAGRTRAHGPAIAIAAVCITSAGLLTFQIVS